MFEFFLNRQKVKQISPLARLGATTSGRHPIRCGAAICSARSLAVAAILAVGLVSAVAADQSAGCVERHSLYIPIQTVSEPLGLRGESRAQYLDRVYGNGQWREGSNGVAAITRVGESLEVTVRERNGVAPARVDVVAEARLAYRNERGVIGNVSGHREVGRYAVPSDARGDLSVPLKVLRESGALLIVVSANLIPSGARMVLVEPWKYEPHDCETRVLVPDRATAIRLNRGLRAQ